MIIFFCAGIFSEMADAKPNIDDPRLDSSTDGEEDGPDARQRRRERREAKKNLVVDEAVLDESEEEEEEEEVLGETPMEQGTVENNAAPQQGTGDVAAEPPAPDPTPAAVEEAPPAASQAVTDPAPDAAASGSGTPHSGITIEKKIETEKNNALLKKPIETVILNFNTEANQSGADVQLSPKPANRSGAVGGGKPNPSGGNSLTGQSDAVNNSYRAVSALKKSSLTNPSIMNGGRVERETGNIGSFVVAGDGRSGICHFRSIIEKKQNVSTSFDPKDLMCSACPGRAAHPVGGGAGSGSVSF